MQLEVAPPSIRGQLGVQGPVVLPAVAAVMSEACKFYGYGDIAALPMTAMPNKTT